MTIEEIKFKWEGQGKALSAAEIDFLLIEHTRLTAAITEKDAEIEKLTHERDLWENIAAMRLADQEAIERHTARRVAGEIMAEIDDLDAETDADFYLCGYIAANTLRYRIRKKYGVE